VELPLLPPSASKRKRLRRHTGLRCVGNFIKVVDAGLETGKVWR
jgi:hypothetical protein